MSRIAYISMGLILYSLAQGATAEDRPAGFTKLCSRDANCTLHTTANVAFGREDRFVFKVLSGTFVCNAETFGSDALAEGECSIPNRLLRSSSRSRGVTWQPVPDGADSST